MKSNEIRSRDDLLKTIKELQEELKQYKEFDSLTGLWRKETFYQKIRERLDADRPENRALVCIDIERFKLINDLYGPSEGDRLLRYLGKKLQERTQKEDELAGHIEADMFALYTVGQNGLAREIETQVLDWLKQYPLNMEIVPAIGIYRIHDDALPVSLMCDRALLAANSVKGNYLRRSAEYHTGLMRSILEEQNLFNTVEHALQHNEFQIYFQPECDTRTRKIVGAEALVRWAHPARGTLPPDAFIPAFEQSGFITKLAAYVREAVCGTLRRWIDSGRQVVPISVNVSRKDLYSPGFCDELIAQVQKYKLPPSLLSLEITESAYTDDPGQIIEAVQTLRAAGFTILMDDFGSGYSSLNMLKDIDIDVLKIDLRFLEKRNDTEHRSENILESIIRMAKWLQICVIVEGVETREQVNFLLSVHCRYAQGFYFYRPLPLEAFEALLEQEDLVDYDGMVPPDKRDITFEDLFQSGMMSKVLLNNIIGGVAIYEYDQGDLSIVHVNDGYYRIAGCGPEMLETRGKHVLERIPEEDRRLVEDALREAREKPSREVEIQFRQRRVCGDLMWLHVRLFFLAEHNGKEIFYASINDITEQKEAEAQLKQSEEMYRMAMTSTGRYPFLFDVEKRGIIYDAGRKTMYGVGRFLSDVPESMIRAGVTAPEHTQRLHDLFYDVIGGKPGSVREMKLRMDDGSFLWKRVTLKTIFDQFGKPVKAYGVVEDITRVMDLEDRLRQGEKLLSDLRADNQRTAVSLLNEMAICGLIGGYCEENFPLYFVNEVMLKLMGYESHEDFMAHTGGFVGNTIHPDDLPMVAANLGETYYPGQEYTVKYRTLRKDGSSFWTLDKGRVVEAEDGRLAIISVCIDLSEQQQAEERLRLADSRFRIAMQMTHADIWEYDIPNKTILRFDPDNAWVKGPEEIGNAPECLIECGWVHPASADECRRVIREVEEGAPQSSCELMALCKDDVYRWFRLTCTVIQQKDGKAVRVLGISENIEEQKKKERQYDKLLRDSQHDPLTGLYNRAAFQDKIVEALAAPRPEEALAAVVLLDIDDFKWVNDTFGHMKGDEVLREIGKTMRDTLGEGVVAGRFGGDEFAFLITGVSYESDACNQVRDLLQQLNAIRVEEDKGHGLSASAGIAFVREEREFNKLYRKADTALYLAKNNGKNTYAVYGGEDGCL